MSTLKSSHKKSLDGSPDGSATVPCMHHGSLRFSVACEMTLCLSRPVNSVLWQVVRRRHAQLSIGHHAPLDADAEVGQAVFLRRVVVLVSMRTAPSVRQNHPRYPGLCGSPYCAICGQERKIVARKPWRESRCRGVRAVACKPLPWRESQKNPNRKDHLWRTVCFFGLRPVGEALMRGTHTRTCG